VPTTIRLQILLRPAMPPGQNMPQVIMAVVIMMNRMKPACR
jgi:hypothetical protein